MLLISGYEIPLVKYWEILSDLLNGWWGANINFSTDSSALLSKFDHSMTGLFGLNILGNWVHTESSSSN